MFKYLPIIFLLLEGCALPKLHGAYFIGTEVQHRCMDMAEIHCMNADVCLSIPHNICMLTMYNQVCSNAKDYGPGYEECFEKIGLQQCGDSPLEICNFAFTIKK